MCSSSWLLKEGSSCQALRIGIATSDAEVLSLTQVLQAVFERPGLEVQGIAACDAWKILIDAASGQLQRRADLLIKPILFNLAPHWQHCAALQRVRCQKLVYPWLCDEKLANV